MAEWNPAGKLTMWTSTQSPHYVHKELAKALGLREDQVRVIAPPVGGGFGGKLELFQHEAAAAKLAMLTGRPIKAALTREEVFYCHRGRHPVLMWLKTGWSNDGKLLGMDFQVVRRRRRVHQLRGGLAVLHGRPADGVRAPARPTASRASGC